MKSTCNRSSSAFSLIEVSLAMGIVFFALVTIIGVLPVGLKSVKDARDEAGAFLTATRIAEALRGARSADGENYIVKLGTEEITFPATNGSVAPTMPKFNQSGNPSYLGEERLAAYLEIRPPADAWSVGSATIHVAWPSSAAFNPSESKWTGAEGSMRNSILWFPR